MIYEVPGLKINETQRINIWYIRKFLYPVLILGAVRSFSGVTEAIMLPRVAAVFMCSKEKLSVTTASL